MSSATWRPSTCTSLTSTSRSMATPRAPPPCLQTTATGSLQRLAALTLPHTATRVPTGQRGAARAPCPPPLPPPARWANTGSILKRSNWAPATTASTPTGRPHTPITRTAARPASPRPRQLRRLQRPSPAPSVTILTSRAPTITTLTLATLPASTSTLTSTHPGGPTAARSSTACLWLLPTAPPPPAGTSPSTPRCLGLKDKKQRQFAPETHSDRCTTNEGSKEQVEKCVKGAVGYLWPFEHETNKRKSACWFYTKLYRRDENTLAQTFYTKTNCVVGEPNSSMRKCRLRLHPVHPPPTPSFQFKIARVVHTWGKAKACHWVV